VVSPANALVDGPCHRERKPGGLQNMLKDSAHGPVPKPASAHELLSEAPESVAELLLIKLRGEDSLEQKVHRGRLTRP
jgi:hypothetical protein